MKRKTSFLVLFACVFLLQAKGQPSKIAFASSGNTIELAVVNSSALPLTDVNVEARNIPLWLSFPVTQQTIRKLGGQEERIASFSFSVDKFAPVNEERTLTFVVSNGNGESWTKEIKIVIAPPERFELFYNYPNPFNPSTTISYDLPSEVNVVLKVYDMLGREVTELINEDQKAGNHQVQFNATPGLSSGTYIYQIQAGSFRDRKKMLFVK